MHTACSSSCLGGSALVHAGIDPLGVGLETPWQDPHQLPPWVWAWRPPWPDPHQLPPWVWAWRPPPPPLTRSSSTSTPGCGPGNLQGMLRYHHPLETCCNACLDTIPSLWTEFLTHASENITLPQLHCERYKCSQTHPLQNYEPVSVYFRPGVIIPFKLGNLVKSFKVTMESISLTILILMKPRKNVLILPKHMCQWLQDCIEPLWLLDLIYWNPNQILVCWRILPHGPNLPLW